MNDLLSSPSTAFKAEVFNRRDSQMQDPAGLEQGEVPSWFSPGDLSDSANKWV